MSKYKAELLPSPACLTLWEPLHVPVADSVSQCTDSTPPDSVDRHLRVSLVSGYCEWHYNKQGGVDVSLRTSLISFDYLPSGGLLGYTAVLFLVFKK